MNKQSWSTAHVRLQFSWPSQLWAFFILKCRHPRANCPFARAKSVIIGECIESILVAGELDVLHGVPWETGKILRRVPLEKVRHAQNTAANFWPHFQSAWLQDYPFISLYDGRIILFKMKVEKITNHAVSGQALWCLIELKGFLGKQFVFFTNTVKARVLVYWIQVCYRPIFNYSIQLLEKWASWNEIFMLLINLPSGKAERNIYWK